jgi:hypothetical protein
MIYDDNLEPAERRALRKHQHHDLAEEIDLLRILIKREMDATGDAEIICKAVDTITKAELARQRLQIKPDDQLRLALHTALNQLDSEAA